MVIYVDEDPECEDCPFYIPDLTNSAVKGMAEEAEPEPVYICWYKAKIVQSQYGSLQIVEKDVRECPFEKLPCLEAEGKCPNCGCEECGESGAEAGGVLGKKPGYSSPVIIGGRKLPIRVRKTQ